MERAEQDVHILDKEFLSKFTVSQLMVVFVSVIQIIQERQRVHPATLVETDAEPQQHEGVDIALQRKKSQAQSVLQEEEDVFSSTPPSPPLSRQSGQTRASTLQEEENVSEASSPGLPPRRQRAWTRANTGVELNQRSSLSEGNSSGDSVTNVADHRENDGQSSSSQQQSKRKRRAQQEETLAKKRPVKDYSFWIRNLQEDKELLWLEERNRIAIFPNMSIEYADEVLDIVASTGNEEVLGILKNMADEEPKETRNNLSSDSVDISRNRAMYNLMKRVVRSGSKEKAVRRLAQYALTRTINNDIEQLKKRRSRSKQRTSSRDPGQARTQVISTFLKEANPDLQCESREWERERDRIRDWINDGRLLVDLVTEFEDDVSVLLLLPYEAKTKRLQDLTKVQRSCLVKTMKTLEPDLSKRSPEAQSAFEEVQKRLEEFVDDGARRYIRAALSMTGTEVVDGNPRECHSFWSPTSLWRRS